MKSQLFLLRRKVWPEICLICLDAYLKSSGKVERILPRGIESQVVKYWGGVGNFKNFLLIRGTAFISLYSDLMASPE